MTLSGQQKAPCTVPSCSSLVATPVPYLCVRPSLQVYRSLLREEFTSGRLEAAPSKAAVLAGLTEKVRFDEEAAKELHRSLYRQKLSSLLEKKALTGGRAFLGDGEGLVWTAAKELECSLYRQKLSSLLAKKALTGACRHWAVSRLGRQAGGEAMARVFF